VRIYPAATLAIGKDSYSIGEIDPIDPSAGPRILKNGVHMPGHATALDDAGGLLWSLSPRTKTWWKTPTKAIAWTEMGPNDPVKGPIPKVLTIDAAAIQASKTELSTATSINADLAPVAQRSSVAGSTLTVNRR
jgi:hypothetical protein